MADNVWFRKAIKHKWVEKQSSALILSYVLRYGSLLQESRVVAVSVKDW